MDHDAHKTTIGNVTLGNTTLDNVMALLARTPGALDAWLRELPDAWTLAREGENTWSAFDVVGHLIHADRTNWLPRAKMVLAFGESRPFEPFRRRGFMQESAGKSLGQLLDEFARVRAESLAELRGLNLRPQDLELRGGHPDLGTTTLGELLAAWAVHDLTHVHQITRMMAHQYTETVGPFRKYLGVLHCAGHGSAG